MKKNNVTQMKNIKKISDVFAKNIIAKNQMTIQMYQYNVTMVYHKQQSDAVEWVLNILYHMKMALNTKSSAIQIAIQKQQIQNIFCISMFSREWSELKNLFLSQQNWNIAFLEKAIDNIETVLKKSTTLNSHFHKMSHEFLNQNMYYNHSHFDNYYNNIVMNYGVLLKRISQKVNHKNLYDLFSKYYVVRNKINYQYDVSNILLKRKRKKEQQKIKYENLKKHEIVSNSILRNRNIKMIQKQYKCLQNSTYNIETMTVWRKYGEANTRTGNKNLKVYKILRNTILINRNIKALQKQYEYLQNSTYNIESMTAWQKYGKVNTRTENKNLKAYKILRNTILINRNIKALQKQYEYLQNSTYNIESMTAWQKYGKVNTRTENKNLKAYKILRNTILINRNIKALQKQYEYLQNSTYNIESMTAWQKYREVNTRTENKNLKVYKILRNTILRNRNVKALQKQYIYQQINKYNLKNIIIEQKHDKESKKLQAQSVHQYLNKKMNNILLKNVIMTEQRYDYKIIQILYNYLVLQHNTITNGIQPFYIYNTYFSAKQLGTQYFMNLRDIIIKHYYKNNVKFTNYLKKLTNGYLTTSLKKANKNLLYDLQKVWKNDNSRVNSFLLIPTINSYNKKYNKLIVDSEEYKAYKIFQKIKQYKYREYLYYKDYANYEIKMYNAHVERIFDKKIFIRKRKQYLQYDIFYIEKKYYFFKPYLFKNILEKNKSFQYHKNTLFNMKQYYTKMNHTIMFYQRNVIQKQAIKRKESATLWKNNDYQTQNNEIVIFYQNSKNIVPKQKMQQKEYIILQNTTDYRTKNSKIAMFYRDNKNIILKQNLEKIKNISLQKNDNYQTKDNKIEIFYQNNKNIIPRQKENITLWKSNSYLKEYNKTTMFYKMKIIQYRKSKIAQNKIWLLEKSNIFDKIYKRSFIQQYDLWNKSEQQLIYLENKEQYNKNETYSEKINNSITKQITEQKQQIQNMIQKEIEMALQKQQQKEIILKQYINDITNQQKSWEKQFDKEKIYQQIYQKLERTLQREKRQWNG